MNTCNGIRFGNEEKISVTLRNSELLLKASNGISWLHMPSGPYAVLRNEDSFLEYRNHVVDIFNKGYIQLQVTDNNISSLSPVVINDILAVLGFQSLILEVTTQCNMRCKYCAYGGIYKGFRTQALRLGN